MVKKKEKTNFKKKRIFDEKEISFYNLKNKIFSK